MTVKMFIFLAISCCGCASENKAQELTKLDASEDLEMLKAEFEKYHPGYNRYTSPDSMAYYFELVEKNLSDMSKLDFYKQINYLVSKVRCGHTRTRMNSKDNSKFIDSNVFLPFTVNLLNDRLYINQSLNLELVSPGDEIISINGMSVDEIVTTIFDHLSSDGFIETGMQRRTERHFNYFFQLYLANGANTYLLKLEKEGIKREISIKGQTWRDLETIQRLVQSSQLLSIDHDTNFSYLKIGTFSNASLENGGHNFTSFLEKSFAELKAKSVENLILDLRGNGGGKDEFGALLNSYLLQKPFGYFHRIEVTDSYSGYGNLDHVGDQNLMTSHSGLAIQQVQQNNFDGKLYLLVDGWTFSTAADVASVLENLDRAIIIGEETGGGQNGNTSGASKSVILINSGISVNIPMWKYTTARKNQHDSGRGVIPNYRVRPTIEQILNDEDAQLIYCLELIK
jgi:C-terminal processing protease CtpA/Prc